MNRPALLARTRPPFPAKGRVGEPTTRADPPRGVGRTFRRGLLLASVFAIGCDANPNAPTAVPPATSSQPPEAAKAKADNPLINRD